jgi:hypothetical protein
MTTTSEPVPAWHWTVCRSDARAFVWPFVHPSIAHTLRSGGSHVGVFPSSPGHVVPPYQETLPMINTAHCILCRTNPASVRANTVHISLCPHAQHAPAHCTVRTSITHHTLPALSSTTTCQLAKLPTCKLANLLTPRHPPSPQTHSSLLTPPLSPLPEFASTPPTLESPPQLAREGELIGDDMALP